ncbi:MAG: hypothetical protein GY710_04850 [Desulfobacteraceae bacterium]|nr:hypothetical protein [Desulfobacteraceae bacterium]
MGSLICRVELHKEKGVIITVENDDDNIIQTMVMDGTLITTTCKGEETSVITQASDSITIKCKDFLLDADTITCQSKNETIHKSESTVKISSAAAMELSSDDALKASAAKDMTLSANAIDAKASPGDVTISGNNVTASGQVKASLKGPTVLIDGQQTAIKGATVDITGSATATLKGSAMTTIGGALIKIG